MKPLSDKKLKFDEYENCYHEVDVEEVVNNTLKEFKDMEPITYMIIKNTFKRKFGDLIND